MGQHLNILIQSSDYYAPFAGVMLTSLFENNKEVGCITVYLMTSDMSENNRERFQILSKQYQRRIEFIDTAKIDRFLEENAVPKYHGSYATYYKLFALPVIEDDLDRLIYLDSDMVVNDSIVELSEMDMKNCVLGMCYEITSEEFKKRIKCNSTYYFNCGMMVIDAKRWKIEGWTDKVLKHIVNEKVIYPSADQDLLNIMFQENIVAVSQRYNLHTAVYIFSDYKLFKSVYGVKNYYSEEEYIKARKNPAIIHYVGPFNTRPWYEDNFIQPKHWPAKDLWIKYQNISPWREFQPIKNRVSRISKMQYMLYIILPNSLFAPIHRSVWKHCIMSQVEKKR